MNISAKIVADSKAFGVRLVTFLVTFPRFILAEVNTHRDLSRNSASSRAIPIERRIQQIKEAPFVPLAFAANKRGMQAGELLDERDNSKAQDAWLRLRDSAVDGVEGLLDAGIHKQWGNRPLEPYAWHTALLTATEWDNFFNLRTHHAAQPEFIELAMKMREALDASTPRDLEPGEWHLPFIEGRPAGGGPWTWEMAIKASVGRCAAVSYDRAEDSRPLADWIAIHDKLRSSGHMSPFEHQAQVVAPANTIAFGAPGLGLDGERFPPPFSPAYVRKPEAEQDPLGVWRMPDGSTDVWEISHYKCGNFRAPWLQYRKTLPNEAVWQGESQ